MKTYNSTIYTVPMVAVLGCLIFIGCDKLDTDYKKYLDGKEIIYPGSPDHITTYPGYNRVQFNWTPSPDPSISRYVIYWNNDTDSVVFDVPEGTQSEFSSVVVDKLDEGTHFFSLYSYDHAGNKSIPKAISNVRVYGDYYVAGLINRPVVGETYVDGSGAVVTAFADPEATNVMTEVVYTSVTNDKKTLELSPSENTVTISDWLEGTPVAYRSSYKPDINAIDVFYPVNYDTLLIKKDVADRFLKNYAQPFAAVQADNRFRDPLDWTVNAAVQNHGGMGGWGSDENTVLVMESGWGTPDIINGKLYQTTRLPAATYTIKLELGGYGYGSSPVRIVAIPGTTLPDYDADGQIPGAFGSADLASRTLTFTVAEEQEVTIGFLATMRGDQYWRVKKIELQQHY